MFFVSSLSGQSIHKEQFVSMGVSFEITLVAHNSAQAENYFNIGKKEINRIENLISSWNPRSQTSQVNLSAGSRGVMVDAELFSLIQRAQTISALTDGAFDITFAAIDPIWAFDGQEKTMPEETVLKASIAKIGYSKIQLDSGSNKVYLPIEGMKIGFGAIGKGYAADRVKKLLKSYGVTSGVINASGDIAAWGAQPDGTPWQIGLVNPMKENKVFAWFPIKDSAVVTSGDYKKYVMIDGERYGHILNPKTGIPSKGLVSVTVFAPKAEMADGLATALFVMGHETGIHLVNQLPEVDALMIDTSGQIFTTKNITIDALD